MFQDLGSALAALQAAKVADFNGRLHGHALEVAEAEQADINGDPFGSVFRLRQYRIG